MAEVVIVGGGVIGLALARDLARARLAPVILLERERAPAQGSTARANGGIRAQFSTAVNIQFSGHTIAELEKLERDTHGLPRLVQAGYLLMTGSARGEEDLRRAFELQRSLGVDVEWLDPERILEKAPFVRSSGLMAGTFSARDGFIDPHGLSQALWQEAREAGAELRLETEVHGIRRETGERYSVSTRGGELRGRWLVNAAGPDAAELAAFLDVDLPVRSVRRNLACTERAAGFPDPIPMCVDLDTGVLIRRESGGFLIAYSNPDDPPGKDQSFDRRFLEDVAGRIGNRFPFLEEIGIDPRKCWAGLYPETPDHHAIVGPTPGHPRFLQCVGFGGHGIMHALAASRAITELVTLGRCETLDIHPLRLSRFAEGDLVVESAVL